MTKFDILLAEIRECNIRTQSQEVQKILDYLEYFANGLGDNWISIEEKLPKKYGRYLCYHPSDEKQVVEPLMIEGTIDKKYLKSLGVSHWQLLPLPPVLESKK